MDAVIRGERLGLDGWYALLSPIKNRLENNDTRKVAASPCQLDLNSSHQG